MTVRLKKDVPSLIILKISKSMKMQKFPDFLGILFLASGIAEFMEKYTGTGPFGHHYM